MKLKKLIEDLPIRIYKGSKEVEITGLCSHSKRVAPGNLFIVKKGAHHDGALFAEEAVSSGAVAILSNFPNPFLKHIVQLICPDVPSVEGVLASRFYHHPSRSLFMVGITGTNGKTTTAYLIKHLLEAAGMPCGLISTIEYGFGTHRFPAELTTPDVIANHKLLREMINQGCKAAVMEVSSHGIEQKRIAGIDFDAAVFTNLSRDHMDYHASMEQYATTKSRLFSTLSSHHTAVVNIDDPWTRNMIEACPAGVISFGFHPQADLFAHKVQLSLKGASFLLTHQNKEYPFSTPLIGAFNVANSLAALGVGLSQGVEIPILQAAIKTFPQVAGRLERVEGIRAPSVFVDFAHTPQALETVLKTMRPLIQGKLLLVFGCGGNRDKGRRKGMAEAAGEHADFSIITSDNPRTEDPLSICEEIASHFPKESLFQIEPDRKAAIQKAFQKALPEDLILIAGKGHETYQIFSHQTVPFDDRLVASACAIRTGACA